MLHRTFDRWLYVLGIALAISCTTSTVSQAQTPDKLSLKATLEDEKVGARWSYNDWDAAKAAAAKSKKPILALFR